MKSILFVLDYYIPHRGGVENVFENIIKRLEAKGYNIYILTSQFNQNLDKFESYGNTKIFRIGKNRISFMIKAISIGKKILNENNIDIIHASTYGGAIPAAILAKKFNKKSILTVHEIFGKLWYKYKGKLKGIIYKSFERYLFRQKFDVYHCVSQNTQKELIQQYHINKEDTIVIHNGIDYDFWNPNNVSSKEIYEWRDKHGWHDKFVFLYFGHAGKSKGIDYLIQALPAIANLENVEVVFNIIDSKRTEEIIQQIYKVPGDNIQVYNGVSKQKLRIMVASCDCVIAPSISEGFGSVHTETVAMGKTLITSKISAIPEVVSGKIRFIKPGDSGEIIQATKDVINGKYENIPTKFFNRDNTVSEIEKLY